MSDLIERLRKHDFLNCGCSSCLLMREAADEIERLNGIINVLGNNIESLNGHIDKLEHIQDK